MTELDPFISRDDLSARLSGRDLSNDDNARIAVDAACGTVRAFTEQMINYVADETITLDGQGTDILILPEWPVVDVSLVIEDDVVITDFSQHDDGTLIRVWPWRVGRNNIEVTYSHGWQEVPSQVRIVALNLAQRLFEFGGGGGIASETIGSYSVSYQATGTLGDLSKTEERMLRRFQRKKQPWGTLVAS